MLYIEQYSHRECLTKDVIIAEHVSPDAPLCTQTWRKHGGNMEEILVQFGHTRSETLYTHYVDIQMSCQVNAV